MTFLPIVVRELRVAARRKSTYRARFWTACSAVALGSYLIFVSGAFMGRLQGAMVFNTLATLCFISCLSLARNTVDCISEEKREGTLGLLFLTDLKGYDIALGKLCSSSLISFYSIVGIFPIVAVSLLLGGVSATEFWQVALALLNVFFFSQSAGILVSALSRKRNTAAFGAAVILLGYTAGFYCLSLALRARRMGPWASLVEWLNPESCVQWACTMGLSPAGAFGRQFGHYWTSLLLVHLNAWLFLAVASWWLPHSWQDKAAKARLRWPERLRQWYHARHTPRRRLLDTNPFLWLSIRNRLGSPRAWSILVAIGCLCVWVLSRVSFRDVGVPLFGTVIVVNHLLLKIFVAGETGGNLEEQRHSGALEFLLSCTPLFVDEIIRGQWLAVRRQLFWPTVAVVVADFAMMLTIMLAGDRDEKLDFVLFVVAVMVMLVPDMIALGWVGMWNGMSQKKPRHAAGATIAQVLLVPWVILISIQALSASSGAEFIGSFPQALVFWFMAGIAVDVIAALRASRKLRTQFRALAAVQSGDALGFFGSLGRWFGTMVRAKP